MSRAVRTSRRAKRWLASLSLTGLLTGSSLPALGQSPGGPAPSEPLGIPINASYDRDVDQTQLPPLPPLPDEPLNLLRPPTEPSFAVPAADAPFELGAMFSHPVDPPNGFAGKSGILPTEPQTSADFVPIHDRWRLGFPTWDRYGKEHPPVDDYPYILGRKWDPYNQNVLKGDFPIVGQHTFFELTATNLTFMQYQRVPTQTGAFESTARAGQFPFFGHPDQFFFSNLTGISLELFHGDAGFKPKDWMIKVTPDFNVNSLSVNELSQVNPNVLSGTRRHRTYFALQEWFGEVKLADLSPNYDFMSARVGSQPFTSDFRALIFSDINRGARIFGTLNSNRNQFNIVYFRQFEKDTFSGLNTFHDRDQDIAIANYYIQDMIWPGYTGEFSFHLNNDSPTFKINRARGLNRPDPAGIFQTHRVQAYYFGFAGDGHIGRINVNNAFYWVVGHDSMNPIANRDVDISAQLAAIELSYDRDWMRFRTSFLWASGDKNLNNNKATGFDSILDNQIFAGGIFSYVQRQSIPIFAVNLFQNTSLLNNLRSSKIQSQSNFVNPGLLLFNVGQDMDLTPKLKMINNMNFNWFDATNVLEQFLFAGHIHRSIGADLSSGFEYRPYLNDNVICIAGLSTFLPGLGFRDLYSNFGRRTDTLFSGFASLVLTY